MKLSDSVIFADFRLTDAGFLEANAKTARAGVQQYQGSEIGRPDIGVVNVYRDANEVFSKSSLDTFSKIPITNDHPPEMVTADNWRRYAVGTTGEEVLRDGEFLKIGLKITDKSAIDAVRSGKKELSVGYDANLVWEDYTAPDGTRCMARQTGIRANHVAIVSRGRAGAEVRIRDSWGATPILDGAKTPYELYKQRLSDAWRGSDNPAPAPQPASVDSIEDANAAAIRAHDAYRERLSNAWRPQP